MTAHQASPVPGILQARTPEWVAISFSNAWKWKVKVKLLSRVRLLATPWTTAYQAPPPMGFSRQEYWSGVPLPSLYDSLGITKRAWSVKEIIDKLDFIKLNTSTLKKTMSREWKDKPQTRIEYLQSIHVIKDCYWNNMKKDAPIRVAKIQYTSNIKFWQGCEATETIIYCWWVWKVLQSLWKTVWQFLRKINKLWWCDPTITVFVIYKEMESIFHFIPTQNSAHRCL